MYIFWSWVAHTRYRNDESSFTVADSSTATLPSAPTLSQVTGGSLAARTRYARVAYVKEQVMFHISNESSLAISANKLLQIASPAAVAGYDGWIPLVGDVPDGERQQSPALPTAPIAFGTNWTEPTTGANITTGTQFTDDGNQQGAHVWDLPVSTTRKFYASYDYINSVVEFSGGALAALSPQQAARQNRYNHYADSPGAMSASTPTAGGSGGGGGGGGGGACWSPESPVRTQRGLVPIAEVRARFDYVSPRPGGWRRVARTFTHEYRGLLHQVPGVGGVTPEHLLSRGSEWPPAAELHPYAEPYEGLVHNLEVEADGFDEHSYEMAGGVYAHNPSSK
jgi:hypothetical protein